MSSIPIAREYVVWGYIREQIEEFIGSNMLTLSEEMQFIELLSKTKIKDINVKDIVLLYRGSENKYSAHKFHELCNGKAPTLVIVQSDFGNIFGGYTTVKWRSNPGKDGGKDLNAFLFLIRSSIETQKCPDIFDCVHPFDCSHPFTYKR
eukprot:UN06429